MMSKATHHTFPKAEKLKHRKSIDALFTAGKAFTAFPLRVVYLLPAAPEATEAALGNEPARVMPQVGVSVSKRSFKHAVDRNRVKRLLREAYRLHKHALEGRIKPGAPPVQVFFIFLDKTLPTYALVEEKMKYAMRRLGRILEGEA
jgi:ribonuclease P protein component